MRAEQPTREQGTEEVSKIDSHCPRKLGKLPEPSDSRDSAELGPEVGKDRGTAGAGVGRWEERATSLGSLTKSKAKTKAMLFTGRKTEEPGPGTRRTCLSHRTVAELRCDASSPSVPVPFRVGSPADPRQAPTQSREKGRCLLPARTGGSCSLGPQSFPEARVD